MKGGRFQKLPASGTLSVMAPPSLATGANTLPSRALCTADGKNVYVGLQTTGYIAQYSRNADGSLAALSPATVQCLYAPYGMVESPDGKQVYCNAGGGDAVRRFTRDTSTGLLTLATSIATGVTPTGICMSADGAYVYVACKNPSGLPSISMYSRNSTTGALTALGTPSITFGVSGSQAMGIVMYGTSVYVGCFTGTTFYAFDQNPTTGQLTAAATASYTAGSQPAWLCIAPDGTSLYVANDSGTISQFSRDTGTGALTSLGSALAAGNGPWCVDITPDGKFVYVACSDGQTVRQFSRNTSTGVLTALSPIEVRADPAVVTVQGSGGPQSVAVSKDGKNLYATCANPAHVVTQFHIRP